MKLKKGLKERALEFEKSMSNSLSGCEWEWETFTTVNDVTPSAEGSFYRGNLITALLALAKEHIRNQMFSGKSYIFSNTKCLSEHTILTGRSERCLTWYECGLEFGAGQLLK